MLNVLRLFNEFLVFNNVDWTIKIKTNATHSQLMAPKINGEQVFFIKQIYILKIPQKRKYFILQHGGFEWTCLFVSV